MGNNHQKRQEKLLLPLRQRAIILHYSYKIKILINDGTKFPHNYEGLRLWDSNIIMGRYVVMHAEKFKNKSVLEMSSGTGLGGISVLKWTQASKVAMTDRSQQVIANLKQNCKNNEIQHPLAYTMSWNESQKFKTEYDIIMCNDPFFHKCSPQTLIKFIEKLLKPGGLVIISAPKSKQLDIFFQILNQDDYSRHKEKLTNPQYFKSPLFNQVDGQQQFKQISNGQIKIYIIKKAVVISSQNSKQIVHGTKCIYEPQAAQIEESLRIRQQLQMQQQMKRRQMGQQVKQGKQNDQNEDLSNSSEYNNSRSEQYNQEQQQENKLEQQNIAQQNRQQKQEQLKKGDKQQQVSNNLNEERQEQNKIEDKEQLQQKQQNKQQQSQKQIQIKEEDQNIKEQQQQNRQQQNREQQRIEQQTKIQQNKEQQIKIEQKDMKQEKMKQQQLQKQQLQKQQLQKQQLQKQQNQVQQTIIQQQIQEKNTKEQQLQLGINSQIKNQKESTNIVNIQSQSSNQNVQSQNKIQIQTNQHAIQQSITKADQQCPQKQIAYQHQTQNISPKIEQNIQNISQNNQKQEQSESKQQSENDLTTIQTSENPTDQKQFIKQQQEQAQVQPKKNRRNKRKKR